MSKVLVAITSYNEVFYDDGAKTGLFVTEALHPYHAFKKAGYEVDFVSETGTFGFDTHSLGEMFLQGADKADFEDENSEFRKQLNKIKKASDINANDYVAIYGSAGHGALYDYPEATDLIKITETIYANGGVISAVCHGIVLLGPVKDTKTNELVLKGKKITGFTDIGEVQLGVQEKMDKDNLETIEAMAKRIGATYLSPEGPWDDFTVVDGRVVTGVNPASATSAAEKVIAILKN